MVHIRRTYPHIEGFSMENGNDQIDQELDLANDPDPRESLPTERATPLISRYRLPPHVCEGKVLVRVGEIEVVISGRSGGGSGWLHAMICSAMRFARRGNRPVRPGGAHRPASRVGRTPSRGPDHRS